MIFSMLALIGSPLSMLALMIAFLSALFICMPFHEFAHAHAAYKEGDLTSRLLGRYTLAPFKHIDTMGLIFLLIFGIGFARPVPVDSRNFKRGTRSEVRVALAGVLINILIGIIACFIYSFVSHFWPQLLSDYGFISELYSNFFYFLINLNFMFAFFNILPIYPLDGFRLVESLSKPNNSYVRIVKAFSFWIMILLLMTNILDIYINFFAGGLYSLVMKCFNFIFGLMV